MKRLQQMIQYAAADLIQSGRWLNYRIKLSCFTEKMRSTSSKGTLNKSIKLKKINNWNTFTNDLMLDGIFQN